MGAHIAAARHLALVKINMEVSMSLNSLLISAGIVFLSVAILLKVFDHTDCQISPQAILRMVDKIIRILLDEFLKPK